MADVGIVEVKVSPESDLEASANLHQLAVNIRRLLSDEVCKSPRVGDGCFLLDRDGSFKGIRENEVEKCLQLDAMSVESLAEQLALQLK